MPGAGHVNAWNERIDEMNIVKLLAPTVLMATLGASGIVYAQAGGDPMQKEAAGEAMGSSRARGIVGAPA